MKEQFATSSLQRKDSVDIIAGILVVYMIFGHIVQHAQMQSLVCYVILRHVFFFFMAWFFFKGGMMHKDRTTKEVIKSGGKRLLLPYLIFTSLGWLLQVIDLVIVGDYNWYHYLLTPIKQILLGEAVQGNLALWFLPTLFAVRVLFNWSHKFVNAHWICIISLLMAYSLYKVGFNSPIWIGNIFLGLAFYSVGSRPIKINKIWSLGFCYLCYSILGGGNFRCSNKYH